MSGPTTAVEAVAHGAIALLFLGLAGLEGSPRVMRVLDSRRTIFVRRTAQYFAAQSYGPGAGVGAGAASGHALAGHQNHHQQQRRPGGSSPATGPSPTSSGSLHALSPRRTSSLGSQSQKPAPAPGETPSLLTDNRFLLGCVALLVGLARGTFMLSVLLLSGSGAASAMTGQGLASDLISLPMACLSYSLVIAVLWAHRDLMSRIRRAHATGLLDPLQTGGGGRSSADMEAAPTNSTSTLAVDVGGAVAVDVQGGVAGASAGGQPCGGCCGAGCCTRLWRGVVVPYRAVLSMLLVAALMVAGMAVEETRGGDFTEYLSPAISLVLAGWGFVATVESYLTLRFLGTASRRVIVAILTLTAYLIARGIYVVPPVQGKVCSAQGDYWQCLFAYSAVDAVGMLLSIAILP